MKYLFFLFLLLIILLLLCFLYTWWKFRQSIYIHANLNQKLIDNYPLDKKSVSFKTSDGEIISAWYTPVINSKAVIILIHGLTDKNGGKALMLPHANYLTKNGYSVLLMDLRSTGESTGSRVHLGTREWKDVEASYNFLKTLPENKDKKIGYFGISMGAATAIITAGKTQRGDFVIASVPYASFNKLFSFQIAREHLYVPLFLPIIKIAAAIELGSHYSDFDPEKLISKIKTHVLIFAAKNDQDVDYKDAEYLYSLANEPKIIWLANTSHDIHKEKPDEFSKRVLDFLSDL
ncbi:hypothetical protein A3D03_02000 [Candidatus Gottesmanbacteria bacterium RIFCSPHIGHO2_02_FULL_40_13]|uniref:Serine aminopeptidase S33 domain-containing protein n=1 Tax=Candidatus Gottesmanbacteria bacterium RIFCSPHIGHO2_02_FULL_40_13 TaxID=1798384 RepID=A0A1F6ABQ6_9BACT|nr:MAG: hypothetical protein A3D03_02000 [Candidatus Gottesmanbacteria bacterium RIFCSPHIGHO2_02_FULL_40_13]